MAYVDYTKLIPPPPEDLVSQLIRMGGFHNTEKIIFGCKYIPNPDTGKNEKRALCSCTDCGTQWYENWTGRVTNRYSGYGIEVYDNYYERVCDGDHWICPHCGRQVELMHISRVNPFSPYNPHRFIGVFGKIDDKFTLTEYCVIKQYFKNGLVRYEIKKWCAYIFEKRKCTKLKAWYKNIGGGIVWRTDWRQMRRCDVEDSADFYYPYKSSFTKGTTMENSRLKEYMTFKGVTYPAEYLRLYQERNAVENLLQIGLVDFVGKEFAQESRGYSTKKVLSELNWKEKSPFKMLGVNREFIQLMKKHKWDMKQLKVMKLAQAQGIKLTDENIRLINRQSLYDQRQLLEGGYENPLRILQYLDKQHQHFKTLEDYWSMAMNLGYDFDNPVIEFPRNLTVAHDRVMARQKNYHDRKTEETFRMLKEKLSVLDFTMGDICIKIAGSGRELVHEGKQLRHCVGGYAAAHCRGNSIFFVRHKMWPDTPWYTLQVNITTGEQLQLHGYHNEQDGQKIPQEVHDFVTYWLANIFKPFDVKEMEFIKPTQKKTA